MKKTLLLLSATLLGFISYSQNTPATHPQPVVSNSSAPKGSTGTTGQAQPASHVATTQATAVTSHSQNLSLDYFEIYTKLAHNRPSSGFSMHRDSILARINNIPDTAATLATFVISLNDPASADSLFYTLTDSKGNIVYTGANKVSALKSNPQFKQSGKTLYLTVGPYPYLKHFTASARVKSTNGRVTQTKTFAKK